MIQLDTGRDIPFDSIYIHQPTLKELSILGDENEIFFACQVLTAGKKLLKGQDKIHQDGIDDFDILLVILSRQIPQLEEAANKVYQFLDLLFPYYQKEFSEQYLLLFNEQQRGTLNKINYPNFVMLIKEIFCLEQFLGKDGSGSGYNPKGAQAARIAQKLLERQQKMQKNKKEAKKDSIIDRYMSILTVGLGYTWNELSNFTFYQLLNTYKRFSMKEDYEAYVDAKMLGADKIKDVPHWRSSFAEAENQIQKQDKKEGKGKRRGNQIIME